MVLFINTSQTNLIQLKLIDKNKVIKQSDCIEEFKHSELLLGLIDKLIESIKLIKLITVVSGPGAFSALRLGIATANTLAWALKVPIVELSIDEVGDDQELIKNIKAKIEKIKDWRIKDFRPIVPKYGREPNITQPKNS